MRKTNKNSKGLELRMYGLVPYNISPIQQAIQFGHAVVEYGQMVKKFGDTYEEYYNQWADNHKTFIILNGGTTSNKTSLESGTPFGTLNKHLLSLVENNITFAKFEEPDLGDQLTAVVFIVDERVFNRKDYLDFGDWVIENYGYDYLNINTHNFITSKQVGNMIMESDLPEHKKLYRKWIKYIGGKSNVFLRDFLQNFRLA